jgi:transcriptional regulator with XRE-family HTH domain
MEHTMSRLGDTIKDAREKAGLTPKALAKKSGVAESYIKDAESGRRVVSDSQAQRILKLLGVRDPVSTELEVAAEAPLLPKPQSRPRLRPYVLPVQDYTKDDDATPGQSEVQASAEAWLDALGGVVKRVPVVNAEGLVIDHRLLPVIGGRIEGGQPDKTLYFRCSDDSLGGFGIKTGDLLLTIPAAAAVDGAIMLIQRNGRRLARKLKKLDGGKLLLMTYDREFECEPVELKTVLIIGHCVRLERQF